MPTRTPHTAPTDRSVVVRDEGDGITRIVLRSRYGLGVNAYLVRRAGVTALIDTGFSHTSAALVEGLSLAGTSLEAVDRVLYTHTHEDHLGGAVALADRWIGDHVCWEGSTPAWDDYVGYYEQIEPWDQWLDRHVGRSDAAHAIDAARVPATSEQLPPTARLRDVQRVPFGARVEVGDLVLECVDGRGHDPFHAGWFEPHRGWLFSGDVLLRVQTPILPSMRDDLATYRGTVERWDERFADARVLPGHGKVEARGADATRRSLRQLHALFDVVSSSVQDDAGCDPAEAALALVGGRPTPAAATQAFVNIGATWSQCRELEQIGAAREEGGRWFSTGAIPDWSELPR